MLNDFNPKALHYCLMDKPPEDIISTDISKCYPSILINNAWPIPMYLIHDTVEEFKCQIDLRHYGEFYIEERMLNNYSLLIKIVAGFYSHNLVSTLVESLHMPLSQIKYKITSKKALKP